MEQSTAEASAAIDQVITLITTYGLDVIGATFPGAPVVVTAKGIEEDSLALPLDVAGKELGRQHPLCVLSGPSL